jgi:MFS family permease
MKTLISRIGLRGYAPGIWVAMIIQAIRFTGLSISFAYLPLYLYQQRHISMTLVGILLLVSGTISGFSQIFGGMLADRFGHRKMFVVFQLTEILMFLLLALMISINASIWSIFLIATLVTVVGNMSAPAISSIVADVSQNHSMNESFGLMAIGGNLGWAIGPLTGGYLKEFTSYAWVFGVGALITSFSLIALPYLPKDRPITVTQSSTNKVKSFVVSDLNLIAFCMICMLFYLEMAQWGSTLSVFTVDRIGFTSGQYGLLMSISAVIIIIFQYPISRRIEWLGYRRALFLGSFLYGAGFLSFALVKSFIPAIGSIVILVTGEMLFVPSSYAVIGRISRLEDRAKSMGMLGLCSTVGSSFGPLIGGLLLDNFPSNPLLLWGPVSLPAFLAAVGFMLWRGYSRTKTTAN